MENVRFPPGIGCTGSETIADSRSVEFGSGGSERRSCLLQDASTEVEELNDRTRPEELPNTS